MKSTTSVNLDCEMWKNLKEYAQIHNRSVSNVVGLLIYASPFYQEFLKEKRKADETK